MNRTIFVLSFFLISVFAINTAAARQKQFVYNNSAGNVITAMTFNIRVDTFLDGFHRWNSRKQMVCDVLANNSPDVAGLQEGLNYQIDDIRQALPQYANYFVGRSDGKQKGESCAILYRKDRFKMDDCGTFWFSDTPEKPSKGWGAMWPRICSWVHLADKKTGDGFYVYNVHLDVLSQNSRQKSAELLAQRIAARKSRDPFIVLGDFNMKLNNSAMAYLLNSSSKTPYPKMTDAMQAIGSDSAENQIDHIPLSSGFTALDVKVDKYNVKGKFPSDHFPVVAKIAMAAATQPVAVNTRLPKPIRD